MIRTLLVTGALLILGTGSSLAADFVHSEHLANAGECITCHLEGAESIKPEESACLECHDDAFLKDVTIPQSATHGLTWSLTHRQEARTQNCAACHEQDFCLECHKAGRADEMGALGNNMINVHTAEFNVTHPLAARTDQRLCLNCHENSYCADCHNKFAPEDLAIASHRRGFTDGTLGGAHATMNEGQCQTCHPGSVLPTHEWSSSHAREARKNLATCQACHPEGNVCLKCHSARSGLMANPHPDDWNSVKNRLDRASDGRSCRKCH